MLSTCVDIAGTCILKNSPIRLLTSAFPVMGDRVWLTYSPFSSAASTSPICMQKVNRYSTRWRRFPPSPLHDCPRMTRRRLMEFENFLLCYTKPLLPSPVSHFILVHYFLVAHSERRYDLRDACVFFGWKFAAKYSSRVFSRRLFSFYSSARVCIFRLFSLHFTWGRRPKFDRGCCINWENWFLLVACAVRIRCWSPLRIWICWRFVLHRRFFPTQYWESACLGILSGPFFRIIFDNFINFLSCQHWVFFYDNFKK